MEAEAGKPALVICDECRSVVWCLKVVCRWPGQLYYYPLHAKSESVEEEPKDECLEEEEQQARG